MTFSSSGNTFNMFGLPVFYFPVIGGSITQHGFPLRSIEMQNSSDFGFGVLTEWGLFESIGQPPPPGLDMAYSVDYFSDRGIAGGLEGRYAGGFITETTRDPWNFRGTFDSYIVDDHGEDDLGRSRVDVEQDELRGRVYWEHQHFIPEDWQIQLRGGYVSDPTFLEEWFEDHFDTGQPHDLSLYLKRQRQTEAFTLAANVQPNDFVTTAEMQQEQFEIERIPEVGYHRIGDSLLGDSLTFFSNNRVGGMRFRESDATLAEQGFRSGQSPGLPSTGFTGIDDETTYRGDFRQEIDAPFSAGQFRVVPYVVGRYTAYSDSPTEGSIDRLYAGTGVRLTTAFWKVNNAAKSDLFDIHRIRHVIEPQIHLYTSVQSEERSDLFIYDEQIDAINDISAAQIALRQRWQTKRGGAGRWRSVDFFTLNIEGNFFANQPSDDELNPVAFRGLFFDSLPETSIPRNSINADALWRVSDSFAVLADAQYNLDESELATASIGVAVHRSGRVVYFLGNRYIEELDSNLTTFSMSYVLSRKYTLGLAQSVDFGVRENIGSAVSLTRSFDRFVMVFRYGYDHTDEDQSFSFAIYPSGLGGVASTSQLSSIFRN